MPAQPITSYAQNREDVVLWRALCEVAEGRYVEIAAHDPSASSVTRTFDDHGWSGITVEAGSALAPYLEDAQRDGRPTHFLLVDAAGAEAGALAVVDLSRWRPWIVVVASIAPHPTTPTDRERILLDADYQFCMFDGVSSYYVAREHADRLAPLLSYPACTLDPYVDDRLRATELEREAALEEAAHWHALAVTKWADALAGASARTVRGDDADQLRQELEAMRQTTSWRITRPLRSVKTLMVRVRRR